jgi:hypothetical protein
MQWLIKVLPRVVQKYFNAVIHCAKDDSGNKIPIPQSLSIEQEGTFLSTATGSPSLLHKNSVQDTTIQDLYGMLS